MSSSVASQQSDKVAAAEQSKPTVLLNFDDEEAPEEEVKHEQEEEVKETDEEKRDDQQEDIVRKSGLSFSMVLFNFFKGLISTGFLALPMAFSDAKPLYSLVLLFAISIISFFVMSNLVKCAQYHYTRLKIFSLSFGDMAEESCKVSFGWAKNHGKLAKTIINMTTVVHQFGICSMFYLFIATSTGHFGVDKDDDSKTEKDFVWFAIIFFPLVFTNAVMTLRILSVLSFIGKGLMMLSLLFVLCILIDNVGKEHSGTYSIYKTSVDSLFKACGTMIFICLAQPMVLTLENEIKRPSQMLGPLGVLSCGMGISTIIYACIGILGYIAFGDDHQGNLMDYFSCTESAIVVLFIRLALCLSVFSSFMLQMFVIVEVLWPHIHHCVKDFSPLVQFVSKLLFRALLVAVCFVISFTVKNSGTIIRLIGVTTGTLLGFIFPALFDLFTFVPLLHSQNRVSEVCARLGLNILVILFGFSILFRGLTVNIITMISEEPKHPCPPNATTMSMESFATITMTIPMG